MERRDFLKAAGAAGLSLISPLGLRSARAAPYEGKFFVMVHAAGGWDPTSLCDPKGRVNEMQPDPVNMFFKDDIGTAGNIQYAPIPYNQEFFDKHHSKLLVINGIDTSTNGHDSGTRNVWSGKLAEGNPSFAAMAAAHLGVDRPLSFVSFGGYDVTGGLVAPTRTGNVSVLERIAFPTRIDTNRANSLYNTDETTARIRKFQLERSVAKVGVEKLPERRKALSSLMIARTGENDIKRLTEYLPTLDGSNNAMRRQAQIAIAAYKAGICVSANLSRGGFDTHGNHDQNHFPRLRSLLEGVDFLMDEAERQGVADKMVVCIGSDFGRTPRYNNGNGKDHWSITSMMFMGAGIPGNKVIGASDDGHRPRTVNPDTLAVDDDGIRITPGHIHRSLRTLAGLSGSELDRQFPVSGAELPLFA